MQKRNAGSALTTVIMVFFLVTLLGAPLLSMIVYNYRYREYDSSIKESEYKNEIVMDRIATIIKNEVIAAISNSKEDTTTAVTEAADTLLNVYNGVYDEVFEEVGKDESILPENKDIKIKEKMEEKLAQKVSAIGEVSETKLVDMLNLDTSEDLAIKKIDNAEFQNICNIIFAEKYQTVLTNSLFQEIYTKKNYEGLADEDLIYFGSEDEAKEENGKTKPISLKVIAKYDRKGKNQFEKIYEKGNSEFPDFDAFDELVIGIETRYKMENSPVTTLKATFVIKTPEFNSISSINQQTIALSNPTLDYSLVVGETLTVNGINYIDGNILALANGVTEENDGKGIVISPSAQLYSGLSDGSITSGRIATLGDILMNDNTSFHTGTNPIYYRNLYLGEPGTFEEGIGGAQVMFNGDVYAKDDLEINFTDPNATFVKQELGKNYFGFNDTNDQGPDSSSAIVINCSKDFRGEISLGNLYLAGRAFIDGVTSTTEVHNITHAPLIYKTGESISVKGNYIAYQTPLIGTTNGGKYDLDKVKFSPYFMTISKDGVENKVALKLVDDFIDEIGVGEFDAKNKWEYFKEYVLGGNSIKAPYIDIADVVHMEGVGVSSEEYNKLIGRKIINRNEDGDLAFRVNGEKNFNKFTSLPSLEERNKVSDWIKFPDNKIEEQIGEVYIYISGKTKENITIDLAGKKPASGSSLKGIILVNGDLTLKLNKVPFEGSIIVTGKLTIEGNYPGGSVIANKNIVSNAIIQNYLGELSSGKLKDGDMLNSFKYDGSGSTYVAVNVSDNSNLIDINKLVGIKDWEKNNFGRL